MRIFVRTTLCTLGLAALAACSGQGNVMSPVGGDADFTPTLGSSDKEQALTLETLEDQTGAKWSATFSPELGTPSFLAGHTDPLASSPSDAPAAAVRWLNDHRALYRMADAAAELAVNRTETDSLGHTHVRLQQVVSGVPVYGGELGVHFDPSGAIEAIAGRYVPNVVSLNVNPTVAESDAVAQATAKLLADRPGLSAAAMRTPTAQLMIYAPNGDAHLAYRVSIAVDDGQHPALEEYWIDAHQKTLIAEFNNLETVSGSGVGVKGDTKTFDVTGSGSSYSLQSTAVNPSGIVTYTAKQAQTQPGTLITSTSPTSWDTGVYGAGSGVDAYYYQGLTYQYYTTVQNRKGIDDNNLKQISTVHYGNKYDNAYWDGSQMVFGDGDGTDFIAFGAGLDVIGHELTHGVTQYTSNLNYQDQPGALNEANSDIMGTFIEFWAGAQGKNHAGNWLIGEDIMAPGSQYGTALRDMAHPKNGQQPDNMSGYVNTSSDNGGVHTNSGIPNNAVYLFANGGTNDTSGKSVSGLGLDKAQKIYFYASSHCYTASTSFAQAANCNVQAAQTLYGSSSCEATTVKNAWIATGVLTGTITACSGSCTPTCSGVTCGSSDGCGGTCQSGSGCTPACTPTCTGVTCGSGDGCGGTCQPGSGCTSSCTPQCSGVTCGSPDGCGGTCQSGSGCTPSCTPTCSGKTCGDNDGCGGTCQSGSGCTPACTPSCAGVTCGTSDGCGGTCQPGSGCTSSGGSTEQEPNGSRSSANSLPMGGSIDGAVSTSSDVDYFKIVVAKHSYIHINVTNLTDDCDLKLYSSSGKLLATSQNWGTTDEDIAGTVSNTTYYAKVYGYHTTCHYTISLTNN